MTADGLQFLVVIIGALTIVAGVITMWNIIEGDREEREEEAARQRIRQRYGPPL